MKTKNALWLIYYLYVYDISLEGILKEQYHLSKHANISINESDKLTEFERKAFINMIIEDLNQEAEAYKDKSNKHI